MKGGEFTEGTIIDGVPYMPLLIKNPNKGKSAIIELLIDSGAQHTLIPKDVLFDSLNLDKRDIIRDVRIQGIVPKEECFVVCPEVLIDFFINRQWLKEIRVIAFDHNLDHGILGRNLLQFFNLELNFLNKTIKFLK